MTDDRGSAVIEFVVICLLLIVPLVSVIAALQKVHRARLALEAQAAVVALALARGDLAPGRVGQVTARIPEFTAMPSDSTFEVHCRPGPCPTRGGTVTVLARGSVLVMSPLDQSIEVAARHVEPVDRYATGHH